MGQHLAFLVWTKASSICITKPSQTSPWISDLERRDKFSQSTLTKNSQRNSAYYSEKNSMYSPKHRCMQQQGGLNSSLVTLEHGYSYLFWPNFSKWCKMSNLSPQWQCTLNKCFFRAVAKSLLPRGRMITVVPFYSYRKYTNVPATSGSYTHCLWAEAGPTLSNTWSQVSRLYDEFGQKFCSAYRVVFHWTQISVWQVLRNSVYKIPRKC